MLIGKYVEVLIYGDGVFKDLVGGIWELVDFVVSFFYIKGLEGILNEIKFKYMLDDKYKDLFGDVFKSVIISEIS